ncbi:MAG TPA: DNA mismatch repair protein MutS [Chloroflexi bacterium]|nr:DNA mismatch repair protein MutS [Chloroflexota bacterium]
MAPITPSRQQYLDIKAQHRDAIVFFRLGDFYETFDEDAHLVARELDLVLTRRHEAPMAGVPYHAVENYIARLIEKGYKVAIAEQLGDPVKGLMPREVTRVVTAGTVVEPTMLDDKRNNYLAAVIYDSSGARAGLAYADITTGEFACTAFRGADIRHQVDEELARLQPAELLIPEGGMEPASRSPTAEMNPAPVANGSGARASTASGLGSRITPVESWRWELATARQTLLGHFEVRTLDGFGCHDKPLAIRAAGTLLAYLQETQRGALDQLTSLHTYSTAAYMTLDAATRRNLELTESLRDGPGESGIRSAPTLLLVLDASRTAMGGRLLRQWINQPLLAREALEARLDAVECLFHDTALRLELQQVLREIADLERLTNRAVTRIATPRDLGAIRATLERIPFIQAVLADMVASDAAARPFALRPEDFDPCDDILALLQEALVDELPATLQKPGTIRPGFSDELDGVTERARHAVEWVKNLEPAERERTGIKSLKVGYNKVFGYYIEVTRANAALVPDDYIRKQTLVNAERYITPELKEYESLLLHAEERQLDIEGRIFRQITEQVAAAAPRLLATGRALAHLDVYASLAEVAIRHRYVRPQLTESDVIRIRNGRHPVVELALHDEPFIANDAFLSREESIHIITGPNMSGKSTYLRQVALIVLLAQIGSFVPADEAEIGLVDRIFTRVGAQDEIARGQSTFMVEMVETANILHHASPRSLLVLDEIGRGTSTYDGISIAWAVVEYIHNHPNLRAKTLFATHYHELTELAGRLPHVANYNVAVAEDGDRVIFLHKIIPGGADRSYGIHVAAIAGLPRTVILRAQEILAQLEQEARAPGSRREAVKALAAQRAASAEQLALFGEPTSHPIVERLQALDVSNVTPVEAIRVLYELCQLIGEDG